MPRWKDGLVNAFPIPKDLRTLQKELKLKEQLALLSLEPVTNPLRFFDFPPEIRNRIYYLVLFTKIEDEYGEVTGDRTAILLTSKRFHSEASYTLYTTHKFLIYPIQEFPPPVTIQALPRHYRVLVTGLQMKIGSSWTSPPRSWRMSKGLERCLKALRNVQTLMVFVELDPSDPVLKVKRDVYEPYIDLCGTLLQEVLGVMPDLRYVEFDGNPGVDVQGPLVSRLRSQVEAEEKVIKWSRQAAWAQDAQNSLDENAWFV